MSRLRIGVIGVGALGRHHARILSALETVELVAVAEPHAGRGQEIAQKHNTRWVADYRELLGVVDAVSIVVPTTAHRDVATEFLQRGIPVLVEKPLASTVEEATALVDLAARNRTILQVGHVERFNPAWQAACTGLGEPRYLRAERLSPFTFRSTDIGVVLDLMIHDLDLALSLVDSEVASVEAFGIGVMGTHEDAVQARLHFANGCVADLAASRIHPTAGRSVHIWSSTGCTSVDLHQRTVGRWTRSPSLMYGTPPVDLARQPGADIESLKSRVFGELLQTTPIDVPAGDALTAELQAFVDCVVHRRRPLVDGEQALRAMAVADRVLEDLRRHACSTLPGERRAA
jgi:predicted dehydrogenase